MSKTKTVTLENVIASVTVVKELTRQTLAKTPSSPSREHYLGMMRAYNEVLGFMGVNTKDPDRSGVCRACKEWTTVEDSCCGAPVWVEGGWESPDVDEGDEEEGGQ